MITNKRTYGHRTDLCIYSHKLRATEISVTADNMACSSNWRPEFGDACVEELTKVKLPDHRKF